MPVIGDLFRNPFRRWFLIFLIIVNILGSIYGYYWYKGQLMETPKELWLFTFDSPFSTTLFALAVLGILMGVPNNLIQLAAYTGVIKYGIWAVAVILHYWLASGSPTFITAALLISHLGMALEGFIFIRHLEVSGLYLFILALWFGVNDYLDYWWGIHPYLYHPNQKVFAMFTALGLSVLIFLYVWRYRLSVGRFMFKKRR
ncbi:MAG: putative membrane protein [Clostridia bacterium 41_269]|nr:MAG: putative membrane protein [Clostridia bacterium 41_269]